MLSVVVMARVAVVLVRCGRRRCLTVIVVSAWKDLRDRCGLVTNC